jgi:hypothetical protein
VHLGRKRAIAILFAFVGMGPIAAGWIGDGGNWESVAIKVGTALALVVVLVFVEDMWRAGADEAIREVRKELMVVRDLANAVAAVQAQQQQTRTTNDRGLTETWKAQPGPGTLCAIRLRCEALGLSVSETVSVGHAAINFFAEQPDSIQITVNPEPASAGAPSSERFRWDRTHGIGDAIEWLNEAMVRLRIHPGSDFEMARVIEELGDLYSTKMSLAF